MADDDTGQPDAGLIEEAAARMARLLADDVSAQDQADCLQWRQQHPQHEQAWQCLLVISNKFTHLPARTPVRKVLQQANDHTLSRRRLLQWSAIGGATFMASGYGLLHTPLIKASLACHQTATGDIKKLQLDDGTELTLNTRSAVDVFFSEQQRRIVLYHGEILIQTGHESPRRPFVVDTEHGRLTALGTRFAVRHHDDYACVSVLDGRVALQSARTGQQQQLNPGQKARLSQTHISPIQTVSETQTAWQQGLLVAEQMTVAEFVEEIRRYRRGFVFYDDAIAGLQLSGVFSLRDTDRALKNLSSTLPVEVVYRSAYWVKLAAQKKS